MRNVCENAICGGVAFAAACDLVLCHHLDGTFLYDFTMHSTQNAQAYGVNMSQ